MNERLQEEARAKRVPGVGPTKVRNRVRPQVLLLISPFWPWICQRKKLGIVVGELVDVKCRVNKRW